jgi:heat shock protein HslJ
VSGGFLSGWMSRVAVVAVLVGVSIIGCSPASSSERPQPRTYVSVSLTDAGRDRPLVPGTEIDIAFNGGNVSASGGCNSAGAAFTIDDGRLVVGDITSTAMGCDPEREAQDQWLLAFLASRPRITFDGDKLVLASDTTVVRLVDRRIVRPDLPLVGPTWTVDTIVNGGGASSIPDGAVATFTFAGDGRLSIQTGCNDGSATVAVEHGILRLADLVVTRRACGLGGATLEDAILRAIGTDVVEYRIEEHRLELTSGGRGLGLRGD